MKATFSVIQVVIFLVIILFAFSSFYGQIFAAEEESRAVKICEQSVEAHTFIRIDGLTFNSELICPTRYKVIEEKDDEKAKQIIAKYMYNCWKQFKAGTKELFYDDYHFCHVCEHIVFEDTERKPIAGFTDYLQDNNIPGGKITFAEYFHKYGGETNFIREDIKKQGNAVYNNKIKIEPDKPYAVLFTYIKGRDALEKYFNVMSHIGEGAAVSIVGMGVMKIGAVLTGSVVGSAVGVPLIIVGGLMTIGGVVWSIVASTIDKAEPQWAAFIELREYNPEEIAKRGCQNIPIRR